MAVLSASKFINLSRLIAIQENSYRTADGLKEYERTEIDNEIIIKENKLTELKIIKQLKERELYENTPPF
jgi:hypothetical protein